MAVHVVHTRFVKVNPVGAVVSKDDNTTTIADHLTGEHQHRIIPDAAIASSANNPTVKIYLEAEDALGFTLRYMDQNTIITYSA